MIQKWIILKSIRKVITGALEKKRIEKLIGSSLEAHIKIYLNDKIMNTITQVDFDEIAITSSFEILNYQKNEKYFLIEDIEGIGVIVEQTNGHKCERCWKYKKELTKLNICDRCEKAIN